MQASALSALLLVFLLAGCCSLLQGPGTPYNISIARSMEPGVHVFFTDKNGANITSSETAQWIYPQETGLAPGTRYSFRFVFPNGTVAIPVYQEGILTAGGSMPELSLNYYHGLPPANYAVEMVVIGNGSGTVAAASTILVYSDEQLQQEMEGQVMSNCSAFIGTEPGQYVSVAGPGQNDTLYGCARNIALERDDMSVCWLLMRLYANNSVFAVSDCISDLALATGNASMCGQLPRLQQDIGLCRALVKNDWHECQRITCDASCALYSLDFQKDGCLKMYAIDKRDRAVCGSIQDAATRQDCLGFNYG